MARAAKAPKLNKKAMIAAIKADGALCEGTLINGKIPGCGHVGRCALGALLFRGGMTNAELKLLSSRGDSYFEPVNPWVSDTEWQPVAIAGKSKKAVAMRKAQRVLANRYGMTAEHHIDDIVGCNDNTFDDTNDDAPSKLARWQARAKAVIAYIKGDYARG